MMARISMAIFIICFLMYFTLASAKKKSKKVDETINSCPLPSDRAGEEPHIYTYEQYVNHFDKTRKITWCQRYFKDNTYFEDYYPKAGDKRRSNANGPVFFMVTGNEPLNKDLMNGNGIWKRLARKYSALRLYLESRSIGLFQPTLNSFKTTYFKNYDLSTENLMNYLSIDQSLADNERFIKSMKNVSSLNEKKWIAFGIYHGGTLTAWLNRKYPGLVDGVVASSAIFPTKPFIPEYYQRVYDQFKNYYQICADTIKKAVEELNYIKTDFTYCFSVQTAFNVDADDFCVDPRKQSRFFQLLAEAIGLFVISKNTKILCEIMTTSLEHDPEFRLAAAIKELKYFQKIDVGYESILLTEPPPGQIVRQLYFQQCTIFGGLLTSESPNQPFFNHFDSEFLLKSTCTDIFGEEYDEQLMVRGINNTIKNFGGLNTKFNNTIFIVGSKSLYYESQMHENNTAGNVVFSIKGGLDCEEMKPPSKNHKSYGDLFRAKRKIDTFVGSLIA